MRKDEGFNISDLVSAFTGVLQLIQCQQAAAAPMGVAPQGYYPSNEGYTATEAAPEDVRGHSVRSHSANRERMYV
jgi:hypothetical protein